MSITCMYELHAYNNKASVVFYVAESDEENLPNLVLVHNSPVLVHPTKHVSKHVNKLGIAWQLGIIYGQYNIHLPSV